MAKTCRIGIAGDGSEYYCDYCHEYFDDRTNLPCEKAEEKMQEEAKTQNLSEYTSAVVPDKTLNEVVPDAPAKNLSEFTTAVPKKKRK